ncbi:hypothetical protein SESBI_38944 [Sesbania bispinosa]|nr:hypothetical protein SESBI_38944 [Sesbania bispinosa]
MPGNYIPLTFTFSTCPKLNPIIIAGVTLVGGIIWCKVGDKTWKAYESKEEYGNLAFHNDKLYAINRDGYKINIFQLRDEPPKLHLFETIYASIPIVSPSNAFKLYLVESNGNLLLVKRYYHHLTWHTTIGFDILKVQEKNCSSPDQLVNVDSLEGQTLFICEYNCESVPGKHCQGLEQDHIYFIDHYNDALKSKLGVFMVNMGRLFRKPLINYSNVYPPIWVMARFAFKCDCKCHSTMWEL